MQTIYRLSFLLLMALCLLPNKGQAQCSPDVIGPVVECSPDSALFILPTNGTIVLSPDELISNVTDNCSAEENIVLTLTLDPNPPSTPTDTDIALGEGSYTIYVHATDEAGNTSVCSRDIIIIEDPCTIDIQAPIAVCEAEIIINGTEDSYTITIDDLDAGSSDNCTPAGELAFGITTNFNQVDPPTETSIEFGEGYHRAILWVTDAAGNSNQCFVDIFINEVDIIKSTVFVDLDGDCEQDPGEPGIPNWPIQFTSANPFLGSFTQQTGPDGMLEFPLYIFDSIPFDSLTVEALMVAGTSTGCPTSYTLGPPFDDLTELSFGIQLEDDCNALLVDISTFRLRPCFNTYYSVNYCNYSNFTVADAEVTVDLDDGLIVTGASIPYTDLGGNSFLFELGDLTSLDCGSFQIDVQVGCDVEVGVTQCATATIEPYTCDDPGDSYTGPSLEITADCDEDNDQVNFRITNIGQGNMTEPVEYNVVEDIVMYMEGQPVQLNSLEFVDLPAFPANGATWRVSVPQPEGHPGLSAPTLFLEGCGGLSSDMVNQFALNEGDPNVSVYCEITSAAYDPNDKQAYPRGYGEENFIEANTALEYLIRFQNTGTDTAFNVIVEDQLDPALDLNSVRAGASSHSYRLELREDGLLRFHFDNIMLPDSNISEINSHGFVQFKVLQKPDNPIGTVIENDAAIFFDFNEPIITNTVFHTIGEQFIITSIVEPVEPGVDLLVAPNPFHNQATMSLDGWEATNAQLLLYNSQGQLLRQENFAGNNLVLNREGLSSGLYFYTVREAGRLLARGRLIVQ